MKTGFQPKFIARHNDGTKNKFEKILALKFPFMKKYEIPTIIDYIDQSPEKDSIYETYGLYDTSKKKKMTKAQQKDFLVTVGEEPEQKNKKTTLKEMSMAYE